MANKIFSVNVVPTAVISGTRWNARSLFSNSVANRASMICDSQRQFTRMIDTGLTVPPVYTEHLHTSYRFDQIRHVRKTSQEMIVDNCRVKLLPFSRAMGRD